MGKGIDNAPVLVQHLSLVLAMFGAVAAERNGHLTSLGSSLDNVGDSHFHTPLVQVFAKG